MTPEWQRLLSEARRRARPVLGARAYINRYADSRPSLNSRLLKRHLDPSFRFQRVASQGLYHQNSSYFPKQEPRTEQDIADNKFWPERVLREWSEGARRCSTQRRIDFTSIPHPAPS